MDWREHFYCNTFTSPAPNVKYHGLQNQGSTCYLNSVLQVLFMTKDFREAVKRHSNEYAGAEFIDHHLAALFDDLQERSACTYDITNSLGIDRVSEQRDAAEYFEMILRLTSPRASQIFHGQLTHKTTCSGCPTEIDADGPFWHLPLALVDSCGEDYSVRASSPIDSQAQQLSVQKLKRCGCIHRFWQNQIQVDGIEEFFKDSVFSGENQMYCEKCEAKVDASSKYIIKHHPDVLMLLLKRFDFSYRYMSYIKIDRVVDVPCTLQIPERQTYELHGFVEHFGDLRGGHYTATIKSQDDKQWYNFNDTQVTQLCYQVDKTQKLQSAYLLFYRKQKNADTQCSNGGSPPLEIPNGGLPSATSDNLDQYQDAEKIRERDKGEDEAGNDPALAVFIDRNEETGTKDTGSVVSRGEGPSPDLCSTVEDTHNDVYVRQIEPYNHQDRNDMQDDVQDSPVNEQERDEGKGMRADEKGIKGKAEEAEADDQAPSSGLLHKETQLKESEKDHEDAGLDFNLEVSDRPAVYGNLSKQEAMINAQSGRVMDGKTDNDEQTGDEYLTEYLDRPADRQDYKGLGNVRQNTSEDRGGKQNIGKGYGLQPASVDKEGDDERMKIHVDNDMEGKPGADKPTLSKKRLLTIYDLCRPDSHEMVGDRKLTIIRDDERYKRGGSNRFYEGRRTEERVDNDHEVRLGTHKDVGVGKQTREHGNERDAEQVQMIASSSGRRAGPGRGGRLTENRGAGCDEMTRQGNSQTKARTGFQEVVDCGSKQSRININIRRKTVENEASDAQVEAAGLRHAMKKRCVHENMDVVKEDMKVLGVREEGAEPKGEEEEEDTRTKGGIT